MLRTDRRSHLVLEWVVFFVWGRIAVRRLLFQLAIFECSILILEWTCGSLGGKGRRVAYLLRFHGRWEGGHWTRKEVRVNNLIMVWLLLVTVLGRDTHMILGSRAGGRVFLTEQFQQIGLNLRVRIRNCLLCLSDVRVRKFSCSWRVDYDLVHFLWAILW